MKFKEYEMPDGKKAVFEYDENGVGKITLECMDDLMGVIADRPQGWIPCSERLPNENEWVLCSCNNGFAILILKLKGKVWHKTEFIEYLPKFVNAWMPLPKPYGEREGE